jgi:hypothetical protein
MPLPSQSPTPVAHPALGFVVEHVYSQGPRYESPAHILLPFKLSQFPRLLSPTRLVFATSGSYNCANIPVRLRKTGPTSIEFVLHHPRTGCLDSLVSPIVVVRVIGMQFVRGRREQVTLRFPPPGNGVITRTTQPLP